MGKLLGTFQQNVRVLAKLLWSSDSIAIAIAFFVDAAGMLKPNCASE
jgi:hypothetical protein